jgi:predicted unusual protein kinase regulating ubiquinone biosynthesis (AarF/ABC1/UbiB family)
LREAFAVPRVVDELSGKMVLTTELMHGRPLKDVSRDEKAAWRKSTRLVKT